MSPVKLRGGAVLDPASDQNFRLRACRDGIFGKAILPQGVCRNRRGGRGDRRDSGSRLRSLRSGWALQASLHSPPPRRVCGLALSPGDVRVALVPSPCGAPGSPVPTAAAIPSCAQDGPSPRPKIALGCIPCNVAEAHLSLLGRDRSPQVASPRGNGCTPCKLRSSSKLPFGVHEADRLSDAASFFGRILP